MRASLLCDRRPSPSGFLDSVQFSFYAVLVLNQTMPTPVCVVSFNFELNKKKKEKKKEVNEVTENNRYEDRS